ncbi:hypothetical protein GN156_05600 [bacterium LRH843]|nr:hypothetical protein [bacterium LRH843]
MENEILLLLKEMNGKIEDMDKKIEKVDKRIDEQERFFKNEFKRIDQRMIGIEEKMTGFEEHMTGIEGRMIEGFKQVNQRLDRHDQLLKTINKMTAMNAEDLSAHRLETNERFDKLELSTYKMQSNIEFLYEESFKHKQDISQLKQQ